MSGAVWIASEQHTIPGLLARRLEASPDGAYLDVAGEAFTPRRIDDQGRRIATALRELGLRPGDRVASLVENSPEAVLYWFGSVLGGLVAVPINSAYKGDYLRHQLADSGARALFVHSDFIDRALEVVPTIDALEVVVAIGEGAAQLDARAFGKAKLVAWEDVLGASCEPVPNDVRPADLGTFIYTGGTTGPSKGCMLTQNYHEALATQIVTQWQATAADTIWTPLPLFHFNALTTTVLGPLVTGGRGAIFRRFSVSQFWPEMNRTGATITSTLGTMAYLLAHDVDRDEMPLSGSPVANRTLRLMGAAPLPPEVDSILRKRFGIETFSGAYGVTEASLISWQPPGTKNKPNAAGIINHDYFDVRIFDDDDRELPRGTDGEIVIRPKRPHVMFEGYWGRPSATVETSRNWWYHTGDIGRIDGEDYLYFVDRKADYLRRRGENISSFEVESVLMKHGKLADVAVHAVPSPLTEDDLKVTATLEEGASLTEEELFRFCIAELPYFALPRYIEFRAELPRSPVGRVLKRVLRDEGVTPATWDADASGIEYAKR